MNEHEASVAKAFIEHKHPYAAVAYTVAVRKPRPSQASPLRSLRLLLVPALMAAPWVPTWLKGVQWPF